MITGRGSICVMGIFINMVESVITWKWVSWHVYEEVIIVVRLIGVEEPSLKADGTITCA